MKATWKLLLAAAIGLAGCDDTSQSANSALSFQAEPARLAVLPCCTAALSYSGAVTVEDIGEDRLIVRLDGVPICKDTIEQVIASGALPGFQIHLGRINSDPMPANDSHPAQSDPMPADGNHEGDSDPMPAKNK